MPMELPHRRSAHMLTEKADGGRKPRRMSLLVTKHLAVHIHLIPIRHRGKAAIYPHSLHEIAHFTLTVSQQILHNQILSIHPFGPHFCTAFGAAQTVSLAIGYNPRQVFIMTQTRYLWSTLVPIAIPKINQNKIKYFPLYYNTCKRLV